MLEIGLTGGIGSGKSTVAEMLVALGAELVDADVVVRQVQQPGSPVLEAMAQHFGAHIINDDGSLNRAAVADIVFGNDEELKALNAIVHPAVNEEMTRQREALVDTDATVLLDIPLLIESKYQGLGGVIVVDAPVKTAIDRLVSFRQFSEADATKRIGSQVSREERLAKADFVVDNSGDLGALQGEVDRCWTWILSLPRPEPGTPLASIRGRAEEPVPAETDTEHGESASAEVAVGEPTDAE